MTNPAYCKNLLDGKTDSKSFYTLALYYLPVVPNCLVCYFCTEKYYPLCFLAYGSKLRLVAHHSSVNSCQAHITQT